MPVLRRLVPCLLLSFFAALPAGAAAQVLATPSVPSKVASYGAVTAYSELDPASGRYRLMYDTNSDGTAEPVPVAARSVPFDVDLGPGPDGRVLAVYSRCRTEPRMDRRSGGAAPVWTTARGCNLYRYDFRRGEESELSGPSTGATTEVLPSIWRGQIAFVRVYHRREGRRGVYPYIYVRDLGPFDSRSRRQPGGARGSTGTPGPMALDLVGSRLAFSWVYERGGGGVSEVRLDTVDRTHQKIAGQGWERSVLRFVSPHVSHGRVYYGAQRTMPGSGAQATRSLGSRLWRYRISTGELSRAGADVPAELFGAVRDRRSLITVYATTDNSLDARSCGGEGCRIVRAQDSPSFSFVRVVGQGERDCGDVSYTPNTDHGAFDVRARGTSCSVARAIARDAEDEPRRFTSRGYRCVGEPRRGGLPRTVFVCRNGDNRVSFSRS